MKNKLFLVVGLSVLSYGIVAEEKSAFAIPLRVEPTSVYSKIRIDGQASENREAKVYERETLGMIEGELKFLSNFSVKIGNTKTRWEKSDSKTLTQNGRLNIGLKYAKEYSVSFGTIAWGGGLRWFDRQSKQFARNEVAPELYLIRPNLNFGLKMGELEFIADLQFQSETNRAFRENAKEEFRRHYQAGLAVSYGLTENIRLFAETEYRKPYQEKVDTNSKFWNVYPGMSYQIYKGGFLSASLQIPVIPERLMDRGIRISYYHVFD